MILETESLHYPGKPWTCPYRVETRIRQENPGRSGFARGSRRLQRCDRQVRFFYTEICVCAGRVDHPRVARKRVQFGEDFVGFRCIANSPEHVRAHAVPGSLRKATAENRARLVALAGQEQSVGKPDGCGSGQWVETPCNLELREGLRDSVEHHQIARVLRSGGG